MFPADINKSRSSIQDGAGSLRPLILQGYERGERGPLLTSNR
jgi:hypothetical protein